MKRAIRTNPKIRKAHILDAAIQLSKKIGYKSVTRDRIALEAKISSALIARYFPRMQDMKSAIIKAAIDKEILEILAQGIAVNDPRVLKISPSLKKKVVSYLINK